jgi:hypothetical protein
MMYGIDGIGNVDKLQRQITSLEQRLIAANADIQYLDETVAALLPYAQHFDTCAIKVDQPCSCGLEDLCDEIIDREND